MNTPELNLSEGADIRTGVDVLTLNRNNEVLLGLHKKATKLVWGFPGGHLFSEETILQAAQRELREELGPAHGIEILSEIVAVRDNCIPPWFVHHLTVVLLGRYTSGEIIRAEPEKLLEWRWFSFDDLPANLYSGVEEILHNFQKKRAWIVTDWPSSSRTVT